MEEGSRGVKALLGTNDCPRLAPRPVFLLAIALSMLGGGVVPASAASAGAEERMGWSITSRQGDTTLVSLVSHQGSATTQFSTASGQPAAPIRGATVRYSDGRVFALDFGKRTFSALSLEAAVARRTAERTLLSGSRPGSAVGIPPGPPAPPPAASLTRLPLTQKIGGVHAHAYLLVDGGKTSRLWYANGLPLPPPRLRAQLALLQPGGAPRARCQQDRDQDGDLDREEGGHQSKGGNRDDCKDRNTARQVAGRALLRVEVKIGSEFTTLLDTQEVRRTKVPAATFAPPSGFQEGKLLTGSSISPATMAAAPALRPGLASSEIIAGPIAAEPLTATARLGPGPISAHPEVWLFYWGHTFKDPAHSNGIQGLNESFGRLYDSRYEKFLAPYGVSGGALKDTFVADENPPSDVGNADFVAIQAFVTRQSFTTPAPIFWWEVGGHDPIYAIFVSKSAVDSSSWSGYHFVAPTPTGFLPFPVNLFAHDAMPFLIVKVPDGALNLPFEGLLFRDQCAADRTSFCIQLRSILADFDEATSTAAHEFVEASTDPYPFFGWSDLGKIPVWTNGELSDICEFTPLPWGSRSRITNTVVATYWSNVAHACVPESRPTVSVLEPHDGDTVRWMAGGARIRVRALGQDPVDGPLTSIRWQVDDLTYATFDAPIFTNGLSLGAHTIQATVTDSQSLMASASVKITVTATPPVATILGPADGAIFGTDQAINFRGDGFDFQDGNLPDSALVWQVNGSVIGTGRLLSRQISTIGDAVITLKATNSAGLSSTASRTMHITAPQGNPTITITQPPDGSGFTDGFKTPILFAALARDAGGAPLPDAAVRWTDDADGFLGTGSTIQHTLSGVGCAVNLHHVTATATNAAGKSASDTITVSVGFIC